MAQGELLVFVSASLLLNHRAPSSSHASSRSAFSSLPSAFAALSLPVKYSLFPSLQNAQLSSQRKPAAIGTKTGRKETASCLFPDPGIPVPTPHTAPRGQPAREPQPQGTIHDQAEVICAATHSPLTLRERKAQVKTHARSPPTAAATCACATRRERTGHFLSSPTGCSTEGAILQKFSQNYGISEFEPESPWAAALPPLQASSAQCEKSAQGLDPEENSPLPVGIMIS